MGILLKVIEWEINFLCHGFLKALDRKHSKDDAHTQIILALIILI
jgi:hypothetical protein